MIVNFALYFNVKKTTPLHFEMNLSNAFFNKRENTLVC